MTQVLRLLDLSKALDGQLSMSEALDELLEALTVNQVPGRNPFHWMTPRPSPPGSIWRAAVWDWSLHCNRKSCGFIQRLATSSVGVIRMALNTWVIIRRSSL
jgi:hypothetical protein